jgi:hypothetical protein
MRNLCQQAGTGVVYGVCIYGTIAEMDKWIPHAPPAMDWYGIDVYDNMDSNNGGSFRNASDAVNDSKINAYMDEFRDLARDRTGLTSPSISIPECNSPILAIPSPFPEPCRVAIRQWRARGIPSSGWRPLCARSRREATIEA